MNKITLTSTQFIAKGRDRACYYHPTRKDLCIKVALKPEKQSLRERAYLRFLTRKKTDLHLISQYRGEVNTNLGKGYLFDLAVNHNGKLSPTLKQAIENGALSQQETHLLLKALKRYLNDNLICVKDLSPNNLAYVTHRKNNAKLFIIDGIGNPNNNPLTIRVKSLIKKAIDKTWIRLERKVNHLYHPNTRAQSLKNKTTKTNAYRPLIVLSIVIFITSISLLTIE